MTLNMLKQQINEGIAKMDQSSSHSAWHIKSEICKLLYALLKSLVAKAGTAGCNSDGLSFDNGICLAEAANFSRNQIELMWTFKDSSPYNHIYYNSFRDRTWAGSLHLIFHRRKLNGHMQFSEIEFCFTDDFLSWSQKNENELLEMDAWEVMNSVAQYGVRMHMRGIIAKLEHTMNNLLMLSAPREHGLHIQEFEKISNMSDKSIYQPISCASDKIPQERYINISFHGDAAYFIAAQAGKRFAKTPGIDEDTASRLIEKAELLGKRYEALIYDDEAARGFVYLQEKPDFLSKDFPDALRDCLSAVAEEDRNTIATAMWANLGNTFGVKKVLLEDFFSTGKDCSGSYMMWLDGELYEGSFLEKDEDLKAILQSGAFVVYD